MELTSENCRCVPCQCPPSWNRISGHKRICRPNPVTALRERSPSMAH